MSSPLYSVQHQHRRSISLVGYFEYQMMDMHGDAWWCPFGPVDTTSVCVCRCPTLSICRSKRKNG
jgi:hypothetical protein